MSIIAKDHLHPRTEVLVDKSSFQYCPQEAPGSLEKCSVTESIRKLVKREQFPSPSSEIYEHSVPNEADPLQTKHQIPRTSHTRPYHSGASLWREAWKEKVPQNQQKGEQCCSNFDAYRLLLGGYINKQSHRDQFDAPDQLG